MQSANAMGRAFQALGRAAEDARTRVAALLKREAVKSVDTPPEQASETREQRRVLDKRQREYDEFWKMQYKGRPARDPQFRLEERAIMRKGLGVVEERREFGPLWRHYHEKYAAENPPRVTEAQRRKLAAMYREAAGPNIEIPAEYRDLPSPRPWPAVAELAERGQRVLRQAVRGEAKKGKGAPSADRGQDMGF